MTGDTFNPVDHIAIRKQLSIAVYVEGGSVIIRSEAPNEGAYDQVIILKTRHACDQLMDALRRAAQKID